jgi:hypothetical protein
MSRTTQDQLKQPQPKQQSQANQQPKSQAKPAATESVREVAYRLWEESGRPDGQSERFWAAAEQKINYTGGKRA